jgi:[protein-PII] uridylyltransferase
LKERIIESLSGKIYLKKELAKLRKSHMSRKEDSFNVAPRIIFDNKASTTDTVIEVNGRDRVGFLYEVTSAINELGLKINSAHITTYGEHVVDTFYIKDIFGLKIEHDVKIERIRKQLIKVVESRPKEYKAPSL